MTLVLRRSDFHGDPLGIWDGLVEGARGVGLLPMGSFDEGETEIDPGEVDIEMEIKITRVGV